MIPIQKRTQLNKLNFEFIINNSKGISVDVFRNDIFVGEGKKQYNNTHDAIIETEAIFYEKYKEEINKLNK